MTGEAMQPEINRSSRFRKFGPLGLLVVGAAAGIWFFGDALSFEALRDNRAELLAWRDASPFIAALVYVLAYIAVVAFSIPGALAMTLTGGFLFGLWWGGALILVAATLGATLIFLAAKTGLGDYLQAKLEKSEGAMSRISRGIRENEVSFLLLMRLVPAVPFFIANLAPAFLGVSLRRYVWTTFFGIMPGTLAYTWVGAGLGAVFDRGETPDLGIIFEPYVIGPLAGLCLLAAVPIGINALRARKNNNNKSEG